MMTQGAIDRAYWIQTLRRICDPVLINLKNRTLRQKMPVEQMEGRCRVPYTYLEAFGRMLAGLAPWLESKNLPEEEESLRQKYAQLCREAIDAATDPQSPDLMAYTSEENTDQPLVDSAFLAIGILRAPTELWEKLPERVKNNLANCLISSRVRISDTENNHLLFAAMVEAGLYRMGIPVQWERVEYALMRHDGWYRGDGIYGDGEEYHWDYYNSFVIQPALVDVYDTFMDSGISSPYLTREKAEHIRARAKRYAKVLEMLIAPDGSFPSFGRSISYRMAAFQDLALFAWKEDLPQDTKPQEIRTALTAVIRRCMETPGTFDEDGWLQIGLCGHQPQMGDYYVSTGSLYACTHVFLPLGLSPDTPFWNSEAALWRNARVWAGQDTLVDGAYEE